jgi:hypothetical protein
MQTAEALLEIIHAECGTGERRAVKIARVVRRGGTRKRVRTCGNLVGGLPGEVR